MDPLKIRIARFKHLVQEYFLFKAAALACLLLLDMLQFRRIKAARFADCGKDFHNIRHFFKRWLPEVFGRFFTQLFFKGR